MTHSAKDRKNGVYTNKLAGMSLQKWVYVVIVELRRKMSSGDHHHINLVVTTVWQPLGNETCSMVMHDCKHLTV